jgi:hypothetical protein
MARDSRCARCKCSLIRPILPSRTCYLFVFIHVSLGSEEGRADTCSTACVELIPARILRSRTFFPRTRSAQLHLVRDSLFAIFRLPIAIVHHSLPSRQKA